MEVVHHDEKRRDSPQPVDEDVAGFGLLVLRGPGGFVGFGGWHGLDPEWRVFGFGANQLANACVQTIDLQFHDRWPSDPNGLQRPDMQSLGKGETSAFGEVP